MAPKALITGATGFIGGHLTAYLIDLGWDITCWCRPESRTLALESLNVKLIRGSLEDTALLEKAVASQDIIFHLAARIHSASRETYEQVNHVFTRNLVEAACRIAPRPQRFIYVSSIAAAGPCQQGQIKTEEDDTPPVTEYGRTKLRGEEAVRENGQRLIFTIIRPPNVFGPGQTESELIIRLMRRRIVPVLRSRIPATTLIYVNDLVQGIVQAALSENARQQTYFLTDGSFYSWRHILFTVKKIVLGGTWYLPLPESAILLAAGIFDGLKRLRVLRSYFGRKAWQSMTRTPWLFSSDKARSQLQFISRYDLEQGLRETIDILDGR